MWHVILGNKLKKFGNHWPTVFGCPWVAPLTKLLGVWLDGRPSGSKASCNGALIDGRCLPLYFMVGMVPSMILLLTARSCFSYLPTLTLLVTLMLQLHTWNCLTPLLLLLLPVQRAFGTTKIRVVVSLSFDSYCPRLTISQVELC